MGCFLIIEFCGSFIYSGSKLFIEYVFCRYLITVCGLSFYSLDRVFGKAEALKLVVLCILFLMTIKSWLIQGHKDFCYIFF